MKKVIILFFLLVAVAVFGQNNTPPPGLTNKPIEQLTSFLNKPVPEGFSRMDRESYRQTGEIEKGILLQKGLIVENGSVKAVAFVWQSDDFEKMVTIVGGLWNLLDQYKLGYPVAEDKIQTMFIYNNRTIILKGIEQAGRTYTFIFSIY